MTLLFLFCVRVTPSILRAVGLLSVCACRLVDVSARVRALSSQICELVNKITFDTHLH